MPTNKQYLDSIAETHLDGWVTFGCVPAPTGYAGNDKGYARIQWREDGVIRSRKSHNYMLRLVAGDPPPDRPEAAHTCRMKGCVNPAHLSWKSAKENQADRLRDGTDSRGENSVQAKLTDDGVREILRLHAEGGWTQQGLGEKFGVSDALICMIVRGKAWNHIERCPPGAPPPV